jgi:hypothetical protein
MNGKIPNKIQFLKVPDGQNVQEELLLILIKKSWRQKAVNREAGVSVIKKAKALKAQYIQGVNK